MYVLKCQIAVGELNCQAAYVEAVVVEVKEPLHVHEPESGVCFKPQAFYLDGEVVVAYSGAAYVGAQVGDSGVRGVEAVFLFSRAHIVGGARRTDYEGVQTQVELCRRLAFVLGREGVDYRLYVQWRVCRVAPYAGVHPYDFHIVHGDVVVEQQVAEVDAGAQPAHM